MFCDLGLLLTLQNLKNISRGVLYLVKPSPNMTFNCHNPIAIKLIVRLRLGLNHLQDYKFKPNFLDCLNPICCCGSNIETAVH